MTQDLIAALRAATLQDFEAAAARIAGDALRTPLLPFSSEDGRVVRLKPECLQPYGSFKIRCGANALGRYSDADLAKGVSTGSAGNFAQGLTLAARRRGVPVTVHVPDSAAGVKLQAIRDLGAEIVTHSFQGWWDILSTRGAGTTEGVFVHPVAEEAVVIGNGTIGLELAADWPELDTVVVPYGGGGMICGIALALRAAGRKVRIVAAEVETSASLSPALAAGEPVVIERRPSFVDGIGSTRVLDEMWPLVRELVDDSVVVGIDEAKAAVRALARTNHLIVEGAGAAALAAARSPKCGGRNVVAVLSGGNIDPSVFCEIVTA